MDRNLRFIGQPTDGLVAPALSQPSEAILVIVQLAGAVAPNGTFALAPEMRYTLPPASTAYAYFARPVVPSGTTNTSAATGRSVVNWRSRVPVAASST